MTSSFSENTSSEWTPLEGGSLNEVCRSGNVVRRPRAPHADSVIQLLNYLTAQGITTTPEVLEVSETNVFFKYIEGEPLLRPWRDVAKTNEWMAQIGKWLKSYHKVVKDFRLQDGAEFLWGPKSSETGMIVCHGDLGPWNFLEKENKLMGVIDWDFAYYGPALDDVAAMAIENVPLRRPKEGSMDDASHEVLKKRLEAFVEAYGDVTVDQVLQRAVSYYDWLLKETTECAARGVSPLDEFEKRGYLQEYVDDQKYIRETWLS